MDGDTADLPALCEIADEQGAILVVDEAHATGVLGANGSGLAEMMAVSDRIDITVSTASKALGGLGGLITADRCVIDTIINRGRCFIYTTAPPPAQVAAINTALEVLGKEPWRRTRLLDLAGTLRERLDKLGLFPDHGHERGLVTPIVPVIAGSATAAVALSEHLERHGFLVPAIRPPTVAPGSCRVRISLRADLEEGDLDRLLDALGAWPRDVVTP